MEMLSSTSPPERTRYSPIPPSHHQMTLPDASHHSLHGTPDSSAKPEKNGHAKDHPKIAKIFEIQSMPNGKTRTSLKTLSRRKLSQQKERKATQMLAIVLGESPCCRPHPALPSPGQGRGSLLQVPLPANLFPASIGELWDWHFLRPRPSLQMHPIRYP